MIALLSALLGFIGSAFPELLRLFRDGKDRAHELALLQLQLDYDREKLAAHQAEAAYKLQEITVQADAAERAALNAGAGTRDGALGIVWVDALSGSVRPLLTYGFFAAYLVVKFCQFRILMHAPLPWQAQLTVAQALETLWTPDDMGIFSAIIAFWFGSRAIAKARK